MTTALALALRAKYPDPRAALRMLGIDEDLLSPAKTTKAPTRFANLALQLVARALEPVLAKDSKIDLMPIFKDLTTKNFKPAPVKMALDAALKGKLAKDADPHMGHVAQLLDHLADIATEKTADESVSEAEHKAMGAAARGHSNLGIPKQVEDEEEFMREHTFDEETIENLREFLRGKGMSEDDVMGACDLLGLPKPATEGGLGGALSEDRMRRRRMAADEHRSDLEQRFPGLRHATIDSIGDQGPPVAPPSGAGISDFASCAARINTSPF